MNATKTIYAVVFLSAVVTTPCIATTDITGSPSKAPAEQGSEKSSLIVTTDYILGPEDVL